MNCYERPGPPPLPFGHSALSCPQPAKVGDGWCDSANNIGGCWDGGDCCASSVTCGGENVLGRYIPCKSGTPPPLNCLAGQPFKVCVLPTSHMHM